MLLRLVAVLAVLLSVPAVFAETPMTKLKIDVRSLSDKPVDRAAVIVQFVEGRSVLKLGKKIQTRWEVRTNQEGIAKIPAIPQGKIRIQVIAKGHQTFGEVFDVAEEEKTLQIKLNPPQPQYSAH
jgi:hypothetical protein